MSSFATLVLKYFFSSNKHLVETSELLNGSFFIFSMKVKTVREFTDAPAAVSIIARILAIPKERSLASQTIQPLPAESQTGTGPPGIILSLFSGLSGYLLMQSTTYSVLMLPPPPPPQHKQCTTTRPQVMQAPVRQPDNSPPSFGLEGRSSNTHASLPLHEITCTPLTVQAQQGRASQ